LKTPGTFSSPYAEARKVRKRTTVLVRGSSIKPKEYGLNGYDTLGFNYVVTGSKSLLFKFPSKLLNSGSIKVNSRGTGKDLISTFYKAKALNSRVRKALVAKLKKNSKLNFKVPFFENSEAPAIQKFDKKKFSNFQKDRFFKKRMVLNKKRVKKQKLILSGINKKECFAPTFGFIRRARLRLRNSSPGVSFGGS